MIGGATLLQPTSAPESSPPLPRHVLGQLVAGIGVAEDAQAGVGGEHALQAFGFFGGAGRYYHHAGVGGVADANAAVVQAHPVGATGAVGQGVEQGQSATASEPSFMPSVSRLGEATEPPSRWSRPMTTGANTSPRHEVVNVAAPQYSTKRLQDW